MALIELAPQARAMLGRDHQLLIGGHWSAATSDGAIDIINPADESRLGALADASDDVGRARIGGASDALPLGDLGTVDRAGGVISRCGIGSQVRSACTLLTVKAPSFSSADVDLVEP